MSKSTLPEAKNWNHYWSLDQTKKFTKISWSKRRILNILKPYARSGQRALDAGCGSGFFSQFFCDAGMNTVSLDYSDEALAIAKEKTRGRTQIVKKNLLDPLLPKDFQTRFDVIFSDGLLEHFPLAQQNQIIQNFKALLKPGGVIVTFVPNKWSPWEVIRPFYMPGIEEEPFILKDLVRLQSSNSLTIIQKGGINTLPFAFSPDHLVGSLFGMLLFTIAKQS
ncbi:MAG: class I SAM-dependent methyltransferase [Candidatus Omnitrophica bacterium]|nr:class I SAM-dependent methyltransferase [Candidatus Omnitrophota bacterium]